MEDVSIDEVIEVCPYITNRIIEYLEDFYDSMNDFEQEYINNILNSNDLITCTDDIQEWQKIGVEKVGQIVSKNDSYLETLREETEKLKLKQNDILKEVARNEREVEVLNKKISNIRKKQEMFSDMRDKVQFCKLLTNTSFVYKGSNISGYTVSSNRRECFELDPETLSENDIINNLYKNVKKVYCNINEPDQ